MAGACPLVAAVARSMLLSRMPVKRSEVPPRVMQVFPAILLGKKLWRRFFKHPWLGVQQALEKRRYHQLWDRQLAAADANAWIHQQLQAGQPLLVARIGHTEGRIVGEWLFQRGRYGRLTRKEAHQYSGIFPVNQQLLSDFAQVYAAAVQQADLLGFWQTTHQARLLAKWQPDISLAPLSALEPYLHPCPWSAALEGRRVLVVHPFAQSILRQYTTNRKRLFPNPAVLPDFELQVLAPPQTLAPSTAGFATWLEALDDLVGRVLEREFDLALLGCGAYGLPLGAAIKQSGRQAIHLGGALQVMFGIRGRRWEEIPGVAALMNDHWIRPSRQETPISAQLVDEGCYW